MNCQETFESLSRFHDGELTQAERAAVEIHLGQCPTCTAELAAVAELSELTRIMVDPEPPDDLWERIDCRLPGSSRILRFGRRQLWPAAAAAMIGLALATGWILHRSEKQPPEIAQAAIPLVDTVVDLGTSLEGMWNRAGSRPVSPQQAARQVDYQVLNASNLPDGYCLEGCCLMKCDCCDMVGCKYCRGSDPLVLVQCPAGLQVQLGTSVPLKTRLNGKPASLTRCGERLAVSWQSRGTAVNLIGPNDLSELTRLMAYVDKRLENQE
jgi:hypothetical protein